MVVVALDIMKAVVVVVATVMVAAVLIVVDVFVDDGGTGVYGSFIGCSVKKG